VRREPDLTRLRRDLQVGWGGGGRLHSKRDVTMCVSSTNVSVIVCWSAGFAQEAAATVSCMCLSAAVLFSVESVALHCAAHAALCCRVASACIMC
jgi:hypothetical protein